MMPSGAVPGANDVELVAAAVDEMARLRERDWRCAEEEQRSTESRTRRAVLIGDD
jgi:hypothetical protein